MRYLDGEHSHSKALKLHAQAGDDIDLQTPDIEDVSKSITG